MEASCNNPAVYQAGRWQQLVSIQHRTLPILLSPSALCKNCSAPVRLFLFILSSVVLAPSTISTSFFILRFFLSSLSLLLFSLPSLIFSPFVPRLKSTLIYARSPAHPFQEWPTCASLSGCLARFTEQSGTWRADIIIPRSAIRNRIRNLCIADSLVDACHANCPNAAPPSLLRARPVFVTRSRVRSIGAIRRLAAKLKVGR